MLTLLLVLKILTGSSRKVNSFPSSGKIILSLLMLAGRLELYTLLAIFLPSFWRR